MDETGFMPRDDWDRIQVIKKEIDALNKEYCAIFKKMNGIRPVQNMRTHPLVKDDLFKKHPLLLEYID